MLNVSIINPKTGETFSNIGGVIYLPFGTEYGIKFSYLGDDRKIKVGVKIDGVDVVNGDELVIFPNTTPTLRSFVSTGNAFRFIQMTDKIRRHRGEKEIDGSIEISYKYEILKDVAIYKCATSCAPEYRSMGITTQGAKTDQKVNNTANFPTEVKTIRIVIELAGTPYTTTNDYPSIVRKTFKQCNICGTQNDHDSNFCKECSTNLVS